MKPRRKIMLTAADLRGNLYLQRTEDLILDDNGIGEGAGRGGVAGGNKKYVLRIRDLPQEEKPREKLIKYGPGALSVAELLTVVLNAGTKKEGVLAMSRRLLKEYGENALISQKDPKKVQAALGIPLVKACQLVATFELGRRFFKAPAAGRPMTIRTASQVFEYLKDMRDLPKEHLRGLYLDSHYQLIHDELISVGSVTANIIHPREVFRPALEHSASAVILAHNHPSGVLKPSDADVAITRQIVEAGKIMGIGVLDHVIITKTKFASVPADY
jgi:DNA repair protein RadC